MLHVVEDRRVLGRAQRTDGRFAQRIGTIAIQAGHVKAVGHNRRMRQHLLRRRDIAFPQVRTDGRNRRLSRRRDGAQPGSDGGFPPIRQQGQDPYVACRELRGNDRDKVTVAFEERNLINPDHRKWCDRVPINAGRDPGVQDAQDRIVAHVFFAHDILDRAVHEHHE